MLREVLVAVLLVQAVMSTNQRADACEAKDEKSSTMASQASVQKTAELSCGVMEVVKVANVVRSV